MPKTEVRTIQNSKQVREVLSSLQHVEKMIEKYYYSWRSPEKTRLLNNLATVRSLLVDKVMRADMKRVQEQEEKERKQKAANQAYRRRQRDARYRQKKREKVMKTKKKSGAKHRKPPITPPSHIPSILGGRA